MFKNELILISQYVHYQVLNSFHTLIAVWIPFQFLFLEIGFEFFHLYFEITHFGFERQDLWRCSKNKVQISSGSNKFEGAAITWNNCKTHSKGQGQIVGTILFYLKCPCHLYGSIYHRMHNWAPHRSVYSKVFVDIEFFFILVLSLRPVRQK